MAQTFFPIAPVDVSPGTTGAWTDVDASAYVPTDGTGVILHYQDSAAGGGLTRKVGIRRNGSTDDRYTDLQTLHHTWAAIGVDSSRVFEAKIEGTSVKIWLVGYTKAGVTFFTNAYDKSLTAIDAWTDIDASAEAPSATGLIFEGNTSITQTGDAIGMRKNGSTDARIGTTLFRNIFAIMIGCDGGQIVEGYIGSTSIDFFLVGYITDGVSWNTNATNVSLSATAAWTDLSNLPSFSVMGIIEYSAPTAGGYDFGLRENGSSEAIIKEGGQHTWAIVDCDNSGVIEGYINNTGQDFFVIGYAQEVAYSIGVAPNITTQLCTAIAATTATGNATIVDLGTTAITQYGHCWATTSNPTTANSKTSLGTGALGSFTSSLTSLIEGQKYYIRAYATNSGGTAYGGNVSWVAGKSWSQLEAGNLKVKGTTVRYIGFDGVEYYIQGVAV